MKRQGFTLVELSIVLVIIGLLIGGILAAQSMIGASKLQMLVRTIQQYDIAATNFETKYNGQIPGDTTLFSPAGNGDGVILSDQHQLQHMTSGYYLEFLNFWQHLNQAGLLSQSFTTYIGGAGFPGDFTGLVPKLNYGTGCFLNAFTDTTSTALLGNFWSISGSASQSLANCMTAVEALAVDTKLDDGKPGLGNVIEQYPAAGPYVNPGSHLGCDNNNSTQYNTQGNWGVPVTAQSCLLAVKAQW